MTPKPSLFQPDTSLLNPRFSSYKTIPGDDNVAETCSNASGSSVRQASFALPGGVLGAGDVTNSISRSEAKRPLMAYKEIKDRTSIQHLQPGKRDGQAAYIDENGFVILVDMDKEGRPSYFPIHRITSDVNKTDELSGLVAVTRDDWLVTDGKGLMTVLKVQLQGRRWVGSTHGQWRWRSDENVQVAFRVVTARSYDNGVVQALLQRTRKMDVTVEGQPGIGAAGSSASTRNTSHTAFDLAVVRLDVRWSDPEAVNEVSVEGTYRSDVPPYYALITANGDVIIYGEQAVVADTNAAEDRTVALPSKKPKEDMDIATEEREAGLAVATGRRIPPYAWHQTPETVIVAMKLPVGTSKAHVRCRFTAEQVQLDLDPQASFAATIKEIDTEEDQPEVESYVAQENSQALLQGKYANRPLWSEIDPSNSIWTFERPTKEDGCSLLTLHLEKKYVGNRWAQVFRQKELQPIMARTNGLEWGDDDEDDIDEVPETIDQSELLNMLEGIEKYTSELDSDVQARSLGGPVGQAPSLLEDGLEEEDANVGNPCIVSRLHDANADVLESSSTLLALPLVHAGIDPAAHVVLRRDLDGLMFAAEPSHTASFRHIDTLPALSYVLASKRDAQRIYAFRPTRKHDFAGHPHPSAVLAFESAPVRQWTESHRGAGNLFVYYSPLKWQPDTASSQPQLASEGQSRVIRLGVIGEQASGPLISACAVEANSAEQGAETKLLVLCQHRLLVLHNIL